ncbi:MAG: acyloxyacyl hydrolase [Bacteroidota bacterium]
MYASKVWKACRISWFLTCILSSLSLFSQEITHFHVHAGLGHVIPIHPDFPPRDQASRHMELGFQWNREKSLTWKSLYKRIQPALIFFIHDLDKNEVLGKSIGLMPTYKILMLEQGRSLIHLELGVSFSWFTQPFNYRDNPGNIVYGTHLNSTSMARLLYRLDLLENWGIELGGSFFHSSNANSRQPNIGTNILAAFVGVNHQLNPPNFHKEKEDLVLINNWGFGMRIGTGWASLGGGGGPPGVIYSSSIYAYRTIFQRRIRLLAGTKAFYNENTRNFIVNRDIDADLPAAGLGAVVYGGAEIMLGHWSYVAHMGGYLKQDYLSNYDLYTQLGIKYYWKDQQLHEGPQPYLGAFVHAHSGQADFSEFCLGWVF